ncbi:MAG: hypothetical protein ACI86P_000182 [Flavobacteriales bacterium]|jgi:hypothetical protein
MKNGLFLKSSIFFSHALYSTYLARVFVVSHILMVDLVKRRFFGIPQ